MQTQFIPAGKKLKVEKSPYNKHSSELISFSTLRCKLTSVWVFMGFWSLFKPQEPSNKIVLFLNSLALTLLFLSKRYNKSSGFTVWNLTACTLASLKNTSIPSVENCCSKT